MTDKQMIDVTKCIHFDKSDIPNGCTCYWDGECNHDCYYKKYIYKEQECERLKHDNDYEVGALEKTIDKLKAENEKFKQALANIKEIIEICKCHNADGCYECKYFDDCEVEGEGIPTRDVCKLILRKIGEVDL